MTQKASDLIPSSPDNPCPVCEKEDGACAWNSDQTMTFCDTVKQMVNANEYQADIETSQKPKPNKNGKFRSPREQERAVTSATVHIQNKVQKLAIEVLEGRESEAAVGVTLAEWCKEHRHDKFAASRLLKERLEAGKKYRAD